MNKLSILALSVICCLCGIAAGAQKSTSSPDLWTANWSLTQASKLNSMPKAAVRSAMNPLWENDASHLCAFQFADLRHSGTLSLVLSYDAGGTADCNYVDVIDKNSSGIDDYNFDSGPGAYFDSVEDVNGNGRQELVVDQPCALRKGDCTATWPVIYAWTGSGYADVSSNYKSWYEQELASLNRQVAAEKEPQEDDSQTPEQSASSSGSPESLSYPAAGNVAEGNAPSPSLIPNRLEGPPQHSVTSPPALMPAKGLSCLKAEVVKIGSFLGVSRDDYISDAIGWANSNDPDDRQFAVGVLFNIGTPEALDYLKTLSQDSNPQVAQNAKWALASVGKPSRIYRVHSKEIPMAQLESPQASQ